MVEIEHLDTNVLDAVAASGVRVHPKPATIRLIQYKYKQKKVFMAAGVVVAPFMKVDTMADAQAAFKRFKGKMLLKTRLGAYDGRGNMVIHNEHDLKKAFKKFGDTPLYAEAFVQFVKELAVMVAK